MRVDGFVRMARSADVESACSLVRVGEGDVLEVDARGLGDLVIWLCGLSAPSEFLGREPRRLANDPGNDGFDPEEGDIVDPCSTPSIEVSSLGLLFVTEALPVIARYLANVSALMPPGTG